MPTSTHVDTVVQSHTHTCTSSPWNKCAPGTFRGTLFFSFFPEENEKWARAQGFLRVWWPKKTLVTEFIVCPHSFAPFQTSFMCTP